MRILIIDDDPQLIRLAAFALRESGIAVTAATTSEEGLCLAASEPFDAVLLDVMMPEIDGPTVLARLRDAPSTHDLPVIFVSAMFRLEELNSLGAQGVIAKPFNHRLLAAQVRKILGQTSSTELSHEAPADLRDAFLLSAVERVEGIERSLDTLRRQPANVELLRRVGARFHSIAGAAASYGLTHVSDAARQGEVESEAAATAGIPTGSETVDRWSELLREMRSDLADAGADANPDACQALAARRAARLLCVSVDPDAMTAIRLLEADSGFLVKFAAHHGAAGVLDDATPDVLVTGNDLADYLLVEHLRKRPNGRRAAVLVVNGDGATAADVRRAVQYGVDDVIADTANVDAVIGKIRAVVDRRFGPPPRVLCFGANEYAEAFATVIVSAGYALRVCTDPAQLDVDLDTFEPDIILAGSLHDPKPAIELARMVLVRLDPIAAPLVLIAPANEPNVLLLAARMGAADFLRIPMSRAQFLNTIENHVRVARAYKMATQRDPLTGCQRDEYFRERLQRRLVDPAVPHPLALALLDTEGFGKRSVIALADLLRRRLRETDEIARCGQRAFAVVMEQITEGAGAALFARLADEFATSVPFDQNPRRTFRAAVSMQRGYRSADRWIQDTERSHGSVPQSTGVRASIV